MAKHIKFTGKLRDLKGLGYEFRYAYANNYRCWSKHTEKNCQQAVRVWDKGKEVEIEDFYQDSHIILQAVVIDGQRGKRYTPDNIVFFHPDNVGFFILDQIDGILHDAKPELESFYLMKDGKDPTKEELDAYYDRYRNITVSDDLVGILQELLDNDMIEIGEDNRK